MISDAAISRPFGLLSSAPPGSSVSFAAFLGDEQVGTSSGDATTQADAAASVEILVKTSTVYHDSAVVEIAYRVRDAAGRSQVLSTDLSVTILLSEPSGVSTSGSCDTADPTTGLGTCQFDVSSLGWFSASSDVLVTATVEVAYAETVVATASSVTVTLQMEPSPTSLSSAGMVMTLPHHPLVAGESFTVDIVADTNGQDLHVWVLEVIFDTELLSYDSTTASALYTSAVANDDGAGVVSMSTSGLSTGTLSADVTGSNVPVASISFVVTDSAPAGSNAGAISFIAKDMVNGGTVKFAADVTGQVNDERGGTQTSGQLTVVALEYVGIFAHTGQSELVNYGPLNGAVSSSTVEAVAVFNRAGEDNVDVSNAVACSHGGSGGSDILALDGCEVTVSSSETAGSLNAVVSVGYDALVSSVEMRVWFPSSLTLNISDAKLGAVYGSTSTPCRRYQRADLTAWATFSTDSGGVSVVADVTSLMTFESSDTSVVAVVGSAVQGIATGTATVACTGLVDGSVEITVSDEGVAVTALNVVVYSGASWVGDIGEVSLDSFVSPILELAHDLSAEGDNANIVVYAEYDDGAYEEVSSEVLLETTDTSGSVSIVDGTAALRVEVGAVSVCGPLIRASWFVCNATLSTGNGVVMLDMPSPSPTGVSVTANKAKIAKSGDGSTERPFSIATSSTLSVVVSFEDGSTQDFSTDSRTSYAIRADGSESMIALDSNIVSVLSDAVIDDSSSLVTVNVSFPGVFDLFATISLTVVEFNGLVLSSSPYPSVSGYAGNVHTLHRVACTSVYQRLEMRATGSLSDGTTRAASSFYTEVSYALEESSVASLSSARYVEAVAAGSATVVGTFGGLSASLIITVTDVSVNVTSLAIKDNIGTSSTLSGSEGTTDTMSVEAEFDDGTSIAIAFSGETSSGWLSPSEILAFSSDIPTVISVTPEGLVELLSNHYSAVSVSATDTCGSGAADSVDVYANLAPEEHDVDLGATTGPPFGTVTVGDTFDVDVRIQASNSFDMTAFQVVVGFDSTLVQVASDSKCVQGGSWSESWECTTNDPVDEVLLIGTCGLSPTTNCGTTGLLTVGTITFEAVAEGTNRFSSFIVKIKDDEKTTIDTDMVAGVDDIVIVSAGGRGKTLSSPYAAPPRSTPVHWRPRQYGGRRLLDDCGSLMGDTNGDCRFDVEDVQFLQYFINGAVDESVLTEAQLSAMDPDLDSDSDGVDIQYLMRVLANKYRFLSTFSAVSSPFGLEATLQTSSSDPATSSQTSLAFEIGTSANRAMHFSVGTGVEQTSDGVYVVAKETSDGVYGVTGTPLASESGVGVVFILETYDAKNATSSDRQFAFYCSRLLAVCVSVYGDDPNAFVPFTTVDLVLMTEVPSSVPTPLPSNFPTLSPTAFPSSLPLPRPSWVPTLAPSPGE